MFHSASFILINFKLKRKIQWTGSNTDKKCNEINYVFYDVSFITKKTFWLCHCLRCVINAVGV